VYRTIKENKGDLIVARRVRKNSDGIKFKTTEKIDPPKDIRVVNSRGETTRFDINKLREDIKLCYGKLHIYEEHLELICDDVILAILSSCEQENGKTVGTEVIEETVLSTLDKIGIPPETVAFRYKTRFCIDSIPKDELEDVISSNFDES